MTRFGDITGLPFPQLAAETSALNTQVYRKKKKPLAALFQFQDIVWNQEITEKFPGSARLDIVSNNPAGVVPPPPFALKAIQSAPGTVSAASKPQRQELTWCGLVR